MSNAFSLESVREGVKPSPRRTVIYGGAGVGKSTWASQWDDAVVIPTEDGVKDLEVAAFNGKEPLQHFSDLKSCIRTLLEQEHDYKTVVLDSADHAEILIHNHVVALDGKVKSVGEIPYAKGYDQAASMWKQMLNGFSLLRSAKKMHVVVIAHARPFRFECPTSSSSYDRYAPKLHKHCNSLLVEWADEVLFAKTEDYVTTSDEGFGRKRTIGIGEGERVLYTEGRPAFVAKNRMSLPAKMSMDFSEYQNYLKGEAKDG